MKNKKINKTQQGFTLIELMVTVAIVGILASIAMPSYQAYVQKSRRTSATSALLDLASREAQYYSTNNVYTATMTTLGYASNSVATPSSTSNYYTLTLAQTTTGNFTGTATPVTGSSQASDSCGTYTITNFGVKTPTTSGCW